MQFVEPIRDKKKIELVKVILKKSGFRNYLLFLLGINSGLTQFPMCCEKCNISVFLCFFEEDF